jgi:hypothetical protein
MSDRDELLRALRGNVDAVELAFMLAKVSHAYDDLVDRDKPVTDETIHETFWLALVEIPRNRFYQQNVLHLQPLIAQSIVSWRVANGLQKAVDREALNVANVLRYAVADVIVHMAYLVGGPDWAAEVGPSLRMLCQKDTLEHFMAEMEVSRGTT